MFSWNIDDGFQMPTLLANVPTNEKKNHMYIDALLHTAASFKRREISTGFFTSFCHFQEISIWTSRVFTQCSSALSHEISCQGHVLIHVCFILWSICIHVQYGKEGPNTTFQRVVSPSLHFVLEVWTRVSLKDSEIFQRSRSAIW